jgi:hypothetical protein
MDGRNQIHLLNRSAAPEPGLSSAHLTDAEFTDILLGAAPPSVSAHLAVCPACAEEAKLFSNAVVSFEQQSRLWAERRASTHSRQASAPSRFTPWLPNPAAWSTAVAALVVAVVLGLTHKAHPTAVLPQPDRQPAAVAAAQPAPELPAAKIKEDNQLLSAIDGELSASDAQLTTTYGLTADSAAGRSRTSRRISN